MAEPTDAEMIEWCEEGAAECDAEARDHRHFCEPTGEEEAEAEATMLRAIAARLRAGVPATTAAPSPRSRP